MESRFHQWIVRRTRGRRAGWMNLKKEKNVQLLPPPEKINPYPYVKNISILNPNTRTYIDARMELDTGYQGPGLITEDTLHSLGIYLTITPPIAYPLCLCLNGEELTSLGTIKLRWKGEGFRKVFETMFHVIPGEDMAWQIILGAEIIHKHGILKFTGFGGHHILGKEAADSRASRDERKRKRDENGETNAAKVEEHKKAKASKNKESAGSSASQYGKQ